MEEFIFSMFASMFRYLFAGYNAWVSPFIQHKHSTSVKHLAGTGVLPEA